MNLEGAKFERKLLRDRYRLPVPAMRTPKLDPIMKPKASSTTKAVDKQLPKVQTLILDTLVPLTTVVESQNRGITLEEKEIIQAVRAEVELVGNANAHLSHLRRERVIRDLNQSLLPSSEMIQIFLRWHPYYSAQNLRSTGRRWWTK